MANHRSPLLFLATLALILPLVSLCPGARAQAPNSYFFPETGHMVQGRFLQYWQSHGGLAQQGYPISDQMQELSSTDGKTYTVQYFERAVFELHSENASPYDVLLSLLGGFLYEQKYPQGAPGQVASSSPDAVLFRETGRKVGGKFLQYWHSHGGLDQQGYPISEEFEEVSPLDGKQYKVQYFERAVFELHPENIGTPYEVLLSQLGTFRYRVRYAAQPPPATSALPSAEAVSYLQTAFDLVREKSIMRDKVDWAKLHDGAFAMITKAISARDTYPAIRYIVKGLGDNHSGFAEPGALADLAQKQTAGMGFVATYLDRKIIDVESGSQAEQMGLRIGDIVLAINDNPTQAMSASQFFTQLYGNGPSVTLTVQHPRSNEPSVINVEHPFVYVSDLPQGRRLVGNIGYLYVPGTGNPAIMGQYPGIMQQIIRDIDQTATCGWVVDLQSDLGGNMWAMLAGVGPVLGEGVVGAFVFADGEQVTWAYSKGTALVGDRATASAGVDYRLRQPSPPVAVLTSGRTASSGEAILIAFRGRPETVSLGEPTLGVPTGVEIEPLSDGAAILLAEAWEADRTGHIYGYNEKIQPDQYVKVSLPLVGTDQDPVLQAATKWLRTQVSCSK